MDKNRKNIEQGMVWTSEEGFYGKTCNYAFPSCKEGYTVFFLEDSMAGNQAYFDNVGSCILWGAYQVFDHEDADVERENMLICEADTMRPVMWVSSEDTLLEYAWVSLEDVNIDEEECTEQAWFIFPAGTYREEIWHWFDRFYSEGVGDLIRCSIGIPALLRGADPRKAGKDAGNADKTLPWLFIAEDGAMDEEAKARIQMTGGVLIDTS